MALLSTKADSGAELAGDAVGRYRLVASAISGRAVEVARADAGETAWTDGVTIFISADIDPGRQRARRNT